MGIEGIPLSKLFSSIPKEVHKRRSLNFTQKKKVISLITTRGYRHKIQNNYQR